MDTYSDYNTLAANETLDQDYRIRVQDLGSKITIAALHGGLIEPRTSLIAGLIADKTCNCYCFEGLKEKNNHQLHITSHRFDEPQALELVSSSDTVISVHACSDTKPIVYIGGLFEDLASRIQDAIESLNIEAARKKRFSGTHPDNICNQGKRQKGVQLEFSRGLRDDPETLFLVSSAIRDALEAHKSKFLQK